MQQPAHGSQSGGLTSELAAQRLAAYGQNVVTVRRRLSAWSSVGAQLRDPLIIVLLGAAALTVATGDSVDAIVIGIVVIVNTSIGVAQEMRADRSITALDSMAAPSVRVLRDDLEVRLASADIVPGDVVLLGEGDVVPADGVVLEAATLMVDESALSGESIPEAKRGPHGDRKGDVVSAGTVLVKGRAIVVVTRTGINSALGQIAQMLDTKVTRTPLQHRLAALGRVIALGAVVLSALVMVIGLARGEPTELMFVVAISLTVAAVPESLPAVVTFALALGARRMAARSAIVRRLAAVETLGSVGVLGTDKTGTLTEGRMAVVEAWVPGQTVVFDRAGAPDPPVLEGSGTARLGDELVVQLLSAAVLCNDATLDGYAPVPQAISGVAGAPFPTRVTSADTPQHLGDPTEVALLLAGASWGLSRPHLERRFPRVNEVPFDSEVQRMTTVHASDGSFLAVTKGSPEAVVALARAHVGDQGASDSDQLAKDTTVAMVKKAGEYAGQGYRVLAVGTEVLDSPAAQSGHGFRLLGLVAIADPPKAAARRTIEACRAAGITPVLITGDHPATARSIAVQVGIIDHDDHEVVTGDRLQRDEIPDLTAPRVFARTAPDQKLAIIQAWRQVGQVVAMTGDGVNDGPALRRSDIGVAMGRRGTEVARQAADLVLADDDLETVVAAVEEGRRVYSNIRRFLVFGLSGGLAAIVIMVTGPMVGLALPLLASQILWINLLTHGLTGVAIGAESPEPDSMSRPPRPPTESVLGGGLWQRTLRISVFISAVAILLALWAHRFGREWQTMLFLTLTCLELGVALALRPKMWTRENLLLPACVIVSLGLAIAGIYVPFLRDLLETVSLPPVDLVVSLAAGVLGWVAVRADRSLFPR